MKFRTGQHKRGWMDILIKTCFAVLSIMVLIFAWSVFGFWENADNQGKQADGGKSIDRIRESKENFHPILPS